MISDQSHQRLAAALSACSFHVLSHSSKAPVGLPGKDEANDVARASHSGSSRPLNHARQREVSDLDSLHDGERRASIKQPNGQSTKANLPRILAS